MIEGDGKLEARLQIEGKDTAALLDLVDSVPPESQFRFTPAFKIAKTYRLSQAGAKVLTGMTAHVSDFVMTATGPRVKVDPEASIEIAPRSGEYKTIPADLLAVLGWDWGLLSERKEGWRSTFKLRGREPDRSRRAEAKLEGMVQHLAQTFAEPPARFHERMRGARWGVAFRRSVPLLVSLGLIGGAAATGSLPLPEDSPYRMMMMNLPGFLMIFAFCRRRMPVIEIPPIPRASKAPAWKEPSPAAPLPAAV
jgi:hypothetical protein